MHSPRPLLMCAVAFSAKFFTSASLMPSDSTAGTGTGGLRKGCVTGQRHV